MAKKKHKKPSTPKTAIESRMQIITVSVDNPYFSASHGESSTNARQIRAQFDARESYAGFLWSKGTIGNDQRKAADRVRHAYERMGGAGAPAMDYGREIVDGGQVAKTITESHLAASATLRECLACLGPEGYDLVIKLAAEGHWPRELWRNNTEHYRRKKAETFRRCLTLLAELWGYVTVTRAVRVA